MRTALLFLMMSAAPAFAGQCYTSEDDPTVTVTVNDAGVEPEMVLKAGDVVTELSSGSGGTGIGRRFATDDEGNSFGFTYVGDVLVFDHGVYRPGCK